MSLSDLATVLPLVLLAACLTETWELQEHIDEGSVCASRIDTDTTEFMVVVPGCMSSTCTQNFVGACTASFDGTEIVLTSDISWEVNVSPRASCTDDCGIPFATCTLEGLPDGTYTVQFGDETLTVELPGEPCEPY
jgi:hypothetical protein